MTEFELEFNDLSLDDQIMQLLQNVKTYQDLDRPNEIKELDQNMCQQVQLLSSSDILKMLTIVENDQKTHKKAVDWTRQKRILLKSEALSVWMCVVRVISSKQQIMAATTILNLKTNLHELLLHESGGRQYIQSHLQLIDIVKNNQPEYNEGTVKLCKTNPQQFNLLLNQVDTEVLSRLSQVLGESQQYLPYQLVIQSALSQLKPANHKNILSLCETYMSLKYHKLAIIELNQLAQKSQDDPLVLFHLGKGYSQLKLFQKAVYEYDRARLLSQGQNNKGLLFECFREMGRISLSLFRIFESALYFKFCTQLRPADIQSCYELAQTFYFGQQYGLCYGIISEFHKKNHNNYSQADHKRVAMLFALEGIALIHLGGINGLSQREAHQLARKSLMEAKKYFQAVWIIEQRYIFKDNVLQNVDQESNRYLRYWEVCWCRVLLKMKKYREVISMLMDRLDKEGGDNCKSDCITITSYILIASASFQIPDQKNLIHYLTKLGTIFKTSPKVIDYMRIQLYEMLHKIISSQFLQRFYGEINKELEKEVSRQIMEEKRRSRIRVNLQRPIPYQLGQQIIDQMHSMYQKLKMGYRKATEMLVQSGQYLYEVQQYTLALYSFSLANSMGLAPSSIHYSLGKCYYKIDELFRAIKHFDKLDSIDLTRMQDLNLVIEAYQKGKKRDRIERFYYRMLELDPGNGHVMLEIGKISYLNQQNDQAQEYLVRSIEAIGMSEQAYELFQLVAAGGNKQKKSLYSKLQQIYQQNPNSISKQLMTKVHLFYQNYQQVKQLLMSIPPQDKNDQYLQLLLVYLQKFSGNVSKEECLVLLGDSNIFDKKSINNQNTLLSLAKVMEAYEYFYDAIKYYEQLIDKFGRVDKLKNLTRCYQRVGNHQKIKQCSAKEVQSINSWLEDNSSFNNSSKLLPSQNLPANTKKITPSSSSISSSQFSQHSEGSSLSHISSVIGDKMNRLLELYKDRKEDKESVYDLLLKIIQMKPTRLEYYYSQMIGLNIEGYQSQQLENNLIKMFEINPLSRYSLNALASAYNKGKITEELQLVFEKYLGKGKQEHNWYRILFYAFLEQHEKSIQHFSHFVSQLRKEKVREKTKKGLEVISALMKNQEYVSQSSYIAIMRGTLYKVINKEEQAKKCFNCLPFSKKQQGQLVKFQSFENKISLFGKNLKEVLMTFVNCYLEL